MSVAEQFIKSGKAKYAGRPVLVVEVPGEQFGADHQGVFRLARLDELFRHAHPEEEPGARGRQVESAAGRGAEVALDEGRGGGQRHVRRNRRADNQVQVFGGNAGHVERLARRLHGELGSCLRRPGLTALLDAGALGDPLVAGVPHLRKVFVCDDLLGQRCAGAENPCQDHIHSRFEYSKLESGDGKRPRRNPPASACGSNSRYPRESEAAARSRWIFSFTLPSANSAATRIAFLMAFAFEPPWQMMHAPRTPRSGAPPYSE